MTDQSIMSDYKKWLLYSFGNQNFESHYDLFNALKSRESFGALTIGESNHAGVNLYTISSEKINESLQITEDQRKDFVEYLVNNYFRTDEVDEIMTEKKRQSEKAANHIYLTEPSHVFSDRENEFKIQPHPKESRYFNIKLVVSILFYVAISGMFVYSVMTDLTMLFSVLLIIPVVLFLFLISKIVKGIFVGVLKGNSIKITKDQFPDIYDIIDTQRKQFKLNHMPDVYISAGHFNAFVTRFSRANILMIYSEVIETTARGNYDVLKYVTAHELCHLKQRHLSKEKYLLPSRIVPFLSLAYSRACEFTCDRAGYHFSPKGSVEGVLIMTLGKEIYSRSNVEVHIKNAVENESFWTWLSEKFLTHPHLYKRLIAIKQYSVYH